MQLPNNTMITANERGQIPLSNILSNQAKTAHILPKLASASLISLGKLCDDDCTIMLHKKVMVAIKNNKIILKGIRNPVDRLWDIPIYKDGIMEKNYPMPPIHPGLYPATPNHPPVQKITPHISRKKFKTAHKYKQHLSVFQ